MELLVALTLVGLIFVALFGGLRFGVRVWETGDERSNSAAEIELAQSLLSRILKQAFVPKAAEDLGTFSGEKDRISFTAPAPSRFLVGGIYLYELVVEEGDEGRNLVISWMLFRNSFPTSDKQDEKETRTLIRDIDRLQIEYFGDPSDSSGLDWYEAWEEAYLPNLIKMNIRFPEGQSRVWPELLIEPFSALKAHKPE